MGNVRHNRFRRTDMTKAAQHLQSFTHHLKAWSTELTNDVRSIKAGLDGPSSAAEASAGSMLSSKKSLLTELEGNLSTASTDLNTAPSLAVLLTSFNSLLAENQGSMATLETHLEQYGYTRPSNDPSDASSKLNTAQSMPPPASVPTLAPMTPVADKKQQQQQQQSSNSNAFTFTPVAPKGPAALTTQPLPSPKPPLASPTRPNAKPLSSMVGSVTPAAAPPPTAEDMKTPTLDDFGGISSSTLAALAKPTGRPSLSPSAAAAISKASGTSAIPQPSKRLSSGRSSLPKPVSSTVSTEPSSSPSKALDFSSVQTSSSPSGPIWAVEASEMTTLPHYLSVQVNHEALNDIIGKINTLCESIPPTESGDLLLTQEDVSGTGIGSKTRAVLLILGRLKRVLAERHDSVTKYRVLTR